MIRKMILGETCFIFLSIFYPRSVDFVHAEPGDMKSQCIYREISGVNIVRPPRAIQEAG